jgi:hypothetical protein
MSVSFTLFHVEVVKFAYRDGAKAPVNAVTALNVSRRKGAGNINLLGLPDVVAFLRG